MGTSFKMNDRIIDFLIITRYDKRKESWQKMNKKSQLLQEPQVDLDY